MTVLNFASATRPGGVTCGSIEKFEHYPWRDRKTCPAFTIDRRYKVSFSPAMPEENGCIEWVRGELTGTCLIDEYCLEEKEPHTHTFDTVLRAACGYAETFSPFRRSTRSSTAHGS